MSVETSKEAEPAGRGRRGGRGRARAGAANTIEQMPWQQPRIPFQPLALLSEDHIEAIHTTSLDVLEEIGMDFLLPEARDLLKKAGADVDPNSERVRFDRGLIEDAIKTAPAEVTMHAR
ncbi:MAG: trimethylamine methyltransferase family protein, partial [Hyphomicrobiales bacterium]